MPETPEVNQQQKSINAEIQKLLVVCPSLLVSGAIHPPRVFKKRKVSDEKVAEKRENLAPLVGCQLVSCISKNNEIALFFKRGTEKICLAIKLALGAVIFWASESDLNRDPLQLKPEEGNTRTNFYFTFNGTDKILVLLDCSQFMNMAIWKIHYNVKFLPEIWKHSGYDAYDSRDNYTKFVLSRYQDRQAEYDQMYMVEFVDCKEVFGSVFGQYTKAEVLGRAYKNLETFSYFQSVGSFNEKFGMMTLLEILYEFLDTNIEWYGKYFDPLTHNKKEIKSFIMDFLVAYRKPHSIHIKMREAKSDKGIYVICSEEEIPSHVWCQLPRSLTEHDLGVGLLCWHSKANLKKDIKIISPEPRQPTLKRRRTKNRPSQSQRRRNKVATFMQEKEKQ